MERREFITALAGIGIGTCGLASILSSCASAPVYRTEATAGKILVPVSIFAAGPVQIIRAGGFPDDIALIRKGEREFLALVLRCTHADNPLESTGNGFSCSLHGSRFDSNGEVTHGPARKPLRRLDTALSGETVAILTAS